MKRIIISAFVALFLISCGTTTSLENSWHDPEARVDMSKLNKVLIVALLRNDIHRRAVETQLAALLKHKGIPSYSYFSDDVNQESEEEVKQKLKNDGFDGAIVLRLADVEKDITYIPGSFNTYPQYYGRFWPYLSGSWTTYYQQGYFETTKKFTIETNVYSLKRDKLVWSGLTSSTDPHSMEKMMQGVAKEIHERMRKDGFIVHQ